MADRDDAQTMFAKVLLEKVRRDANPSSTHMTILEQTMPADMRDEYVAVLLEKVLADESPSITMLRRIARVTQAM